MTRTLAILGGAGVPLLRALEAAPDTTLALTRAGLKTIADLLDRPSHLLAARFGQEFIRRLDRLAGREDRRLTPRRTPPAVTVERRFAEPVGREDDVRATLAALATRVVALLAERGEGGRRFEASLFRTDGAIRRLGVETGRPSREAAAIHRLFRERLDSLADPLDPGFGFDLVRLAVTASEPLDARQASLDGREQADVETAALVDRLATRFGRESVLRFSPRESHIPERAEALTPALDKAPATWPASSGRSTPRSIFSSGSRCWPSQAWSAGKTSVGKATMPGSRSRSSVWWIMSVL